MHTSRYPRTNCCGSMRRARDSTNYFQTLISIQGSGFFYRSNPASTDQVRRNQESAKISRLKFPKTASCAGGQGGGGPSDEQSRCSTLINVQNSREKKIACAKTRCQNQSSVKIPSDTSGGDMPSEKGEALLSHRQRGCIRQACANIHMCALKDKYLYGSVTQASPDVSVTV